VADVIAFPDEAKRALLGARRLVADRVFGQIAQGDTAAARATLEEHLKAEAESDEACAAERAAIIEEVKRLLDGGLVSDAGAKLNSLIAKPARIEVISGMGIFAALPPTNWLVEGLEMAPGAPSLWAGFGFGGKSYAAQALAISVASGVPVWGDAGLQCRQGRVLHLDFEQGRTLTLRRYQKLARGLGLGPDDVGDRLAVAPLPPLSLAAANGEPWLMEQCKDTALCIVDSFRAACPEVDENSSEARRPLDMLNRVSEATGCAFLVIHHARKPDRGGASDSGGARMAIRGSSGLYDACASVFVFEGKKGEPTVLKHEKARISGKTRDDFAIEIRDVEDGYGHWDGLEVAVTAAAPLSASAPGVVRAEETAKTQAAIEAVLLDHPEGLSGHALREKVGGNRDRVLGCLDLLVASGRVVVSNGQRNAKLHRLARQDQGSKEDVS
jgi:hypothetical protein